MNTDKIDIFKNHLHMYGELEKKTESQLSYHLQELDTKNLSIKDISEIAKKISFFINNNINIDVCEINLDNQVLKSTIFDFSIGDKNEFLLHYNNLNKNTLLVYDPNHYLNINDKFILLHEYRESNLIKEYFNYLKYDFLMNLNAMYKNVVLDVPTEYCGFFGYIHIVEVLVKDYTFFTR